ncbi:MAG: 1-acyl-sn-glycerol-3-phosphate acyltransferase [Candidatus Coatesbacteria bacterium]|nr:1-acyl-sn-glycerol-3-phosphate acyltransferase [Candidatus Coatesbacteria bacterium]
MAEEREAVSGRAGGRSAESRGTDSFFSKGLYGACRVVGWVLSKVFLRAELVGGENIPRKGRAIFASNHRSYADPPLLGFMIFRPLHFVAKSELFRIPVFGWLIRKVHAFPVRRSGIDREMLRQALAILHAERALLLFPEGTRSMNDDLLPPMPGVGFLADKSGAPVIPTYIHNSWRILPPGSAIVRPHKLYVCLGEPMRAPAHAEAEARSAVHAEFAAEVMSRISRLRTELLQRIDPSRSCNQKEGAR